MYNLLYYLKLPIVYIFIQMYNLLDKTSNIQKLFPVHKKHKKTLFIIIYQKLFICAYAYIYYGKGNLTIQHSIRNSQQNKRGKRIILRSNIKINKKKERKYNKYFWLC